MSNPQTRLESIRPSVREDLRYVTDLLGRDPEPSTDFRVWNDATTRLQRVTAAFEALDDQPLAQLGKASLEFAHLLASQQFDDASEASQRLLATLQILADHSHRVSASSTNRDDTHWHQHLLNALGAETTAKNRTNQSTVHNTEDYRAAASQHVQAYQESLLNWLTGRDTDQSLAQLTRILQILKPVMSDTPIAHLADLAESWRDRNESLDGHARQCLSRAERLLQQMAAGEDFSARAKELNEKIKPMLEVLPNADGSGLSINVPEVDQSGYWRPPRPAPADREAWTGLASALRDDLRYVIESLDVATRVAPSQAPDMRMVSERIKGASHVLSATYMEDWATQLMTLAEKVAKTPGRAECLRLAEKIQDVMACLEPEVIEQRQQNLGGGSVSTRDAVAELSRTAVVDAALGSIARLSARFEIIATSDYRPSNMRPTEEIDALWGAARVLDWDSLSDATAWLRKCAEEYLESGNNDSRHNLLGTLLTGCVVVERFLQTVRLPWPDIQRAETEMHNALQQLAPSQFAN